LYCLAKAGELTRLVLQPLAEDASQSRHKRKATQRKPSHGGHTQLQMVVMACPSLICLKQLWSKMQVLQVRLKAAKTLADDTGGVRSGQASSLLERGIIVQDLHDPLLGVRVNA